MDAHPGANLYRSSGEVLACTALSLGPLVPCRARQQRPEGVFPHAAILARPAGACSKGAVSVSGGAGRTGNACGGCGGVWYDGRRVSGVKGPAAHPLLLCTATSGRLQRPRESQESCKGGEGMQGDMRRPGRMARGSMSGRHAHEAQGVGMIPTPAAQPAAPRCAPVCSGRQT